MDEHLPPLNELTSALRAGLPAIFHATPVMLAYLFGSRVEGYARPDSDADIAIVLASENSLSGYERMRLEFTLAEAIEALGLFSEADVRSIDTAPLAVQGHVLTYGILLYSRDEEFRVEYEATTRMKYFDFLPVIEQMRNALYASVRSKGV
jgi:predicted nucleotidyltransferase